MLSALTNSPRFDDAKCQDEANLDFFFPESLVEWEERLPRLKQLCGSCIYQAPCLKYAITNEIRHGFWAGTTPDEREQQFLKKQDRHSQRIQEIQTLLFEGFSREQVAIRMGIQVQSLERTLDRAKRKGKLK
jgi:hypothetical protein